MKLSLSVRIVESTCKTKLHLPFDDIVAIAKKTGYDAICMRASAGGVQTPVEQLNRMQLSVRQSELHISMVTTDTNVPLNNENGPDSLRNIGSSLDVAAALGCDLIRVCLKKQEDIASARSAADEAADRNIRLAHQCHTSSLFEQVDPMLNVLAEIGRPNFGIIYEPANLLLCGQSHGLQTLQQLEPYIMNVYLQNHRLDPAAPECLPTYCRGDVRFHHLDPWETGGVDMEQVLDGLKSIAYDGPITIHQAQGIETRDQAVAFAGRCADLVRRGWSH